MEMARYARVPAKLSEAILEEHRRQHQQAVGK
jgi:hypothetical protein